MIENYEPISQRTLQIIATFLLIIAIFDVFYWTCYFFFPEIVQSSTENWYLTYEDSFPLADIWLGICALLAGSLLFRYGTDRNSGPFYAVISGALLIYLGLLDLLFNINNNIFSTIGLEQIIEAIIV
ncbi:MAG: hypothetical protein ACFFCQ_12530, partial [Promethearchaeota archaeon]